MIITLLIITALNITIGMFLFSGVMWDIIIKFYIHKGSRNVKEKWDEDD